jgi:hypothetical protein
LTLIGVEVSLVSEKPSPPAFTAWGESVSEGCSAYPFRNSLVVRRRLVLGGVGDGGGVDDAGGVPPESSCPPQAARMAATAAATLMRTVVRFMVCPYQSLALVGEPAIGVLRYGKTVR